MGIKVIGIGSGSLDLLLPRAKNAILEADIIVGYKRYIDLLKPVFHKNFVSFSMGEELKRVEFAIEEAKLGKNVAVVSSGDPGIYGMLGIFLEKGIDVESIPGVPSFVLAAHLAGAPIMNDFAVISLSDRLVEWKKIEKRIRGAREGDFVIVFMNPGSKGRRFHLSRAMEIIGDVNLPVAVVENAGRSGEKTTIGKVGDFIGKEFTSMNATIFVGNSDTVVIGGKIVTKRGYGV